MRRFRRSLMFLTLAVAVFSIPSCVSGIDPDAVSPLINDVSNRHDAYVQSDSKLEDVERSTYLRSTQLLRQVVDEAKAAKK